PFSPLSLHDALPIWRGLDLIAERLPFEQFRDDEQRVVVLSEVVDGENVRMRERRDGARLALEPRHRFVVVGGVRAEDFNGDLASEARIAGAIDLTHPAFAEERDDLVGSDSRAGREHAGTF